MDSSCLTNPAEAWPMLHEHLACLLHAEDKKSNFQSSILHICQIGRQLMECKPDDSLFVLVQMLSDANFGYSMTHALLSAAICQLVALPAGLSEVDADVVMQAALTMNWGMTELHDKLAHQLRDVDGFQQQQIKEHPLKSAELLRRCGVVDPVWLQLVEDHHESLDGTGYPSGKSDLSPVQQLLHMADLLVARISPRGTRRGLPTRVALGNLYIEALQQGNSFGALLAKQLGMYPPGTFVRLRNEETAVVVRRGTRVNTPLTMVIADVEGMPVLMPKRRDTEIPTYTILGSVAPEDVHIRLDVARLLERV